MVTRVILTLVALILPLKTDSVVVRAFPVEQMCFEETLEEKIFRILRENGVSEELALIIVAQAKHESGNFKSKIFTENNNLFGMKVPKKREHLCVGKKYGHAIYNTIEDSIRDYILWMNYFSAPKDANLKEYIDFLKSKRYFEDKKTNYIRGVKHFYENTNIRYRDIQVAFCTCNNE